MHIFKTNSDASDYRGRYAPSPTGPLHFGSLVAAAASYLDARSRNGTWLLRIDDLDTPRVSKAATTDILHTLSAFGFISDDAVTYQSNRTEAYHAAIHLLRAIDKIYPCACSRREIADSSTIIGIEGAVYPGTCRHGLPSGKSARALRLDTRGMRVQFDDALQGCVSQDVENQIGDFVLYRADHIYSYQLAVTVDDDAQGITDVVRGADLLASTPRQICLQQLLGLPTPRYLHVPVAINAAGEKLSKQTRATAIDVDTPRPALLAALDFLGHAPPPSLRDTPLSGIWRWAIEHWDRKLLPRTLKQTAASI